jgi:hypothetical protein
MAPVVDEVVRTDNRSVANKVNCCMEVDDGMKQQNGRQFTHRSGGFSRFGPVCGVKESFQGDDGSIRVCILINLLLTTTPSGEMTHRPTENSVRATDDGS